MSNLHDISERMPHLTVVADDGVHVLPRSAVQNVISGAECSQALTEPVIRRILEEWLLFTEESAQ